MSLLNIKRFVDIDIIRHQSSTISGSRETVIVLHDGTYTGELTQQEFEALGTAVLTTISDNAQKFAKIFYKNKGRKIKFVVNATIDDTFVGALGNDYLLVVDTVSETLAEINAQIALVNNLEVKGIDKKLFIFELSGASALDDHNKLIVTNSDAAIVTTSKLTIDALDNATGISGAIAAYLSKIDVYKQDQVWDYMYTITKYYLGYAQDSEIDDDWYGHCLEANVLPYSKLANEYRAINGNLTSGTDIVNEYVRILLHQTLTYKVLNTLSKKIKGNKGIASIYSTIAQELNYYVTNGYLTTDKVWEDEDLNVVYGNPPMTYNIIKQGTALTTGYKVVILPLTSLTPEDKDARKTPPIYILLAEQYGIRSITINGEII